MKISILAVVAALLFTANAFSMGNGTKSAGNKTSIECPYKASMKLKASTNPVQVASSAVKAQSNGNAQDGVVKSN
jgi:hypothetical protein